MCILTYIIMYSSNSGECCVIAQLDNYSPCTFAHACTHTQHTQAAAIPLSSRKHCRAQCTRRNRHRQYHRLGNTCVIYSFYTITHITILLIAYKSRYICSFLICIAYCMYYIMQLHLHVYYGFIDASVLMIM